MATIDVKDAAGDVVAVEKPLTPGAAQAADSRPVALSLEDVARVGSLTETAPATDIASSGLNGRLQRLAQHLASVITVLPAARGTGTAASSAGVALSTEDVARQGIVTETAPATDTASSGINGRLQRIAQRATSLIALLPASIGVKLTATSLSTTIATDDAVIGALTETAPATDTASSGLNGRLQRIAQRITSTLATFGAPTDAKSTSTDGTSTTIVSILKQISASVQAPSSTATTVVDGGSVTLGAKADAKSTATDTTAITIMSVLKQISASVQLWGATAITFGAGAVAAGTPRFTHASDDPVAAVLGTTSGAAVVTDATGTAQQYLRGLVKLQVDAATSDAAQATAANQTTEIAALGAPADAAWASGDGTLVALLKALNTNVTATTVTLGTATAANSLPVTQATDEFRYVGLVPTCDATACVIYDVLAATEVWAAVCRGNDIPGVLKDLTIRRLDAATGLDLRIWFLKANSSVGAENAAFAPADADVDDILFYVDVGASDWIVTTGMVNAFVQKDVGKIIVPATGTDDIYVAIQCMGAVDIGAATDIVMAGTFA